MLTAAGAHSIVFTPQMFVPAPLPRAEQGRGGAGGSWPAFHGHSCALQWCFPEGTTCPATQNVLLSGAEIWVCTMMVGYSVLGVFLFVVCLFVLRVALSVGRAE